MNRIRDLLLYLATRYTVTLYAIGLTLITAAFVIGAAEKPTIASILLESTGYAIIAGTLVASVMHFKFESSINSAFKIVKGTEAARVSSIYADRSIAMIEVNDVTRAAREAIDIMTVSGTSTIHLGDVIKNIERACGPKSPVAVRILILDPRSRYAFERSLREESEDFPPKNPARFDYENRTLCTDSINSLLEIERLLAGSSTTLEARLYNAAPMLWYVRADEEVFVEQYHYGIPPRQIKSKLTRCLGKSVPVLKIEQGSDLGKVYASHFEYIWERASQRRVTIGTRNKIQADLAHLNASAFFTAESNAEDARLNLP